MIACNACQLLATNLPVCHSCLLEGFLGPLRPLLILLIFMLTYFFLILLQEQIDMQKPILFATFMSPVWLNLVFGGMMLGSTSHHLKMIAIDDLSTSQHVIILTCYLNIILILRYFLKKAYEI